MKTVRAYDDLRTIRLNEHFVIPHINGIHYDSIIVDGIGYDGTRHRFLLTCHPDVTGDIPKNLDALQSAYGNHFTYSWSLRGGDSDLLALLAKLEKTGHLYGASSSDFRTVKDKQALTTGAVGITSPKEMVSKTGFVLDDTLFEIETIKLNQS